eukprot:CAMPEP_0172546052 /NCGR_PEP_ID=MMETSP1067-20121228/15879_1 /TAXON_ID=265564 ORGANISM="Thalassiosira punctigera, Strain Tpunct2005C2" /NCGR_SAMPLE_ID=MMETSP1067 /ASSEMBLY_ACC=CAM_ASM_000444 /LENGTH=48 /DNA_ID= /DNA_START= /DNA_END= /DNA_ORIENTATION=
MAKTTKNAPTKAEPKAAAKAVAKKDGKKKRSRTGKASKPSFSTYIYRV